MIKQQPFQQKNVICSPRYLLLDVVKRRPGAGPLCSAARFSPSEASLILFVIVRYFSELSQGFLTSLFELLKLVEISLENQRHFDPVIPRVTLATLTYYCLNLFVGLLLIGIEDFSNRVER